MPLTTTDANNVTTQITYGDVTCPGGTVTDLYPTLTEIAEGTTVERTSSAVYDCYTGLTTSTTDEDNDVTNSVEYDALGRPTKAITADGDATWESWTITEYYDADRFVVVKSDLETKDDRKKVATQFYDQLGRVRLSKTLEDASTQSATNETDGIKVQTRYATTYSSPNGYTYQLTSNPFRAATSSTASSEPTMGWTRSKTHHLGRHSEVETFAGSALPAPWGSNTSSTGVVQTDIDANATTVTDQAGKLRRSITNGLGQLIRVDEPNSSNQLGSVSSPNQATHYSYETLGKLVHVEQGDQHRYFMYSTLGRMIRVKQPEQTVNTGLNTTGNPDNNSWTAGFSYDNNGNVLTATDAKGTTTTSTYDALNRATQRSYNDSPQTPTVTFTYDEFDHSKGKLTKVSSSISESRYTQFDLLGRLKQYQQYTDGQTYTSSYDYNLSGALIKETYPSGRVVQNSLDADGQISRIYGKANSSATERTYANTFSYTADGRIEKLRLGNMLWEAAKLNNRLQVTEFSLGHGVSAGDVWKNSYEYGELQTNGTVDGTKNSGNIGRQTVTFSGLANPFIQSYTYDPLYRLTEVKETSNGTQTWKQTFGYDRYGNRTSYDKWLGTTSQSLSTVEEPAIDNTTNRISSSGYTFDANGNLIVDADGRQFTFNGDNKQTKVLDDEDVTLGEYFFDGEGKRVKKVTATETTVFVYSGSKLIAEYSTATPPSNPTTSWTVTDQLGSPRVIVDALGAVVSRRDFMPFGEEIDPDGTYRTTGQKYGQADSVRQRFTGYQKDEETGLDFAEARMYHNLHGRFTAIDPLLSSGKSANPQTFNRYVYVMNSPIALTDKSGMQAGEEIVISIWVTKAGKLIDDIREFVNATVQERSQWLMNGVSNNSSTLDQINFERAQARINAMRGDMDAAESFNRTILPNQGPTVDSAIQALTDARERARVVGETGILINSFLLGVPVPSGSNTVTTNLGGPLRSGTGFSFGNSIGNQSEGLASPYPPNNGFLGNPTTTTLSPGTTIDRFGGTPGRFFAPSGTPLTNRSMPPWSDTSQLMTFRVIKPFTVQTGRAAPFYGEKGFGTQYFSSQRSDTLVRRGILEVIKP